MIKSRNNLLITPYSLLLTPYSFLIDSTLINFIKHIKMTIVKKLNINPSYIIPINKNSIPRTASGKIKRKQLVSFFQEGKFDNIINQIKNKTKKERKEKYIKAENTIEKELQILWSNLFSLKNIGIQENFFDLGGTSLLASQLVSIINSKFSVNLLIESIFKYPTIYLLSQYIQNQIEQKNQKENNQKSSLIKIKSDGKKIPLYFINSTTVAYNICQYVESQQPLFGLNIFGVTTRINKSFEQLTMVDFAQYLIEDLLEFQPTGSYKLITFCQDGALALEIAQQLQQMGKKVDSLILIDVLFQKEKLKLSDRFKLIYNFRIPYLKTKLNSLFNQKIFKDKQSKNITKDSKLKEKITLDEKLYLAYFRQAEKYNPQKYNGKIISFLSQEWSNKKQDKLQSISENPIKSITIKIPHSLIFYPQYIQKFIKELNVILNCDSNNNY